MSISQQNFDYLADVIKNESGIVVSKDKMYLLQTRLSTLAGRHDCTDINALANKMRKLDPGKVLMTEVIDAMTTNESLFFRDMKPFDALRDEIFPEIEKNNANHQFRIWSAACSTGQEPYSITILMNETGRGNRFRIEATDISDEALVRAKNGLYSQFEVQRGMPIKMLLNYFTQDGTHWKVKPDYTGPISFAKGNLLAPPRIGARFDVILCRNVLIYFDKETKDKVLENLISALAPGGFLILGGSENLLGLQAAAAFDRFGKFPAIYRKKLPQ